MYVETWQEMNVILYHWTIDQTDKNVSQGTTIWTAFDCPNGFHLKTVDLFIEETIYSINFLFITSASFKWQILRTVISNGTEWLRCHFLNTPVLSEIRPYRLRICYCPFGDVCFLHLKGSRRKTALRNGCIIWGNSWFGDSLSQPGLWVLWRWRQWSPPNRR